MTGAPGTSTPTAACWSPTIRRSADAVSAGDVVHLRRASGRRRPSGASRSEPATGPYDVLMGQDRSLAVGEESVEILHPHWKTLRGAGRCSRSSSSPSLLVGEVLIPREQGGGDRAAGARRGRHRAAHVVADAPGAALAHHGLRADDQAACGCATASSPATGGTSRCRGSPTSPSARGCSTGCSAAARLVVESAGEHGELDADRDPARGTGVGPPVPAGRGRAAARRPARAARSG